MKKIILLTIFVLTLYPLTATADTYLQRITQLCGALIDDVCTTQQKTAMANAYVAHYRTEIIHRGLDPDSLTDTQKAAAVVLMIKKHSRNLIEIHDPNVETAQDSLNTATSTATTDAETSFPDESMGE